MNTDYHRLYKKYRGKYLNVTGGDDTTPPTTPRGRSTSTQTIEPRGIYTYIYKLGNMEITREESDLKPDLYRQSLQFGSRWDMEGPDGQSVICAASQQPKRGGVINEFIFNCTIRQG